LIKINKAGRQTHRPWALGSLSSLRLPFGTRFTEVGADRRVRDEHTGSL
jgi:hypothetical protein